MSRSKVYKDIRDKLIELMPELYVDLQKGQLKNKKSKNFPIPLPAALIEFKSTKWDKATGLQIGSPDISISLYLDNVTESFVGAEAENKSLEILDKIDFFGEELDGLESEYFSPLNLTEDSIIGYENGIFAFQIDFSTSIYVDKHIEEMVKKPNVKFKF